MAACAAEAGDTFGVVWTDNAAEIVTAATEGAQVITITLVHRVGDVDIIYGTPSQGTGFVTVGTAVDAVNEV